MMWKEDLRRGLGIGSVGRFCGSLWVVVLIAGCPSSGGGKVEDAKGPNAFVEITSRFSPTPMTQGWGGLAVFDFDRDGDLDVFLSGGPGEPNRLYRNDNQGEAFVDVAEPAGVTTVEDHIAGTGVGDFNGDGWLDLVLTRQLYLVPESVTDTSCLLFLNNGDGTFVDQTAASGLGAVPIDGMGVAVADVNRDGLLDLYVDQYRLREINGFAPVEPSSPNVLFINRGIEDGVPMFEDATSSAGVAGQLLAGRTAETADQMFYAVTVATYATDVDRDGHIDCS